MVWLGFWNRKWIGTENKRWGCPSLWDVKRGGMGCAWPVWSAGECSMCPGLGVGWVGGAACPF